MTHLSSYQRWIPFLLLMVMLAAFFYFRLYHYLNFESLATHRQLLLQWTHDHYVLTVMSYILFYTFAVAASVPGAVFFTLTGGFLFGLWLGTFYAVLSATCGATLLFVAIRLAFFDWFKAKTAHWLKQMEQGLQNHAFYYLLTLRFIPLFPFWLVNAIPALLGIPLSTFFFATLIGIIPGAFIYASIGHGLSTVFDKHQTPNLNILFQANILLPLLGLALLSLLPVIYKHYKKK